jgi:hypothetical protein
MPQPPGDGAGYDDAWVDVDGLQMKSVTGGGHSGAGLLLIQKTHGTFGVIFK